MKKIQVDIVGLSATPTGPSSYALILKEVGGDRRLPIIIGSFEAQAIALEMEGIKPPRPLTHDLIKNILDGLGVNILEVVVTDLRDGTFYAKIYLELNGMTYEIDSRPSDAIAIALRCGVPIYVNDEVMEEASFAPEEESQIEEEAEEEEENPLAPPNLFLQLLIAHLQSSDFITNFRSFLVLFFFNCLFKLSLKFSYSLLF